MDPKFWAQSKTIWLSAAVILLGLLEWLNVHPALVEALVKPEYGGTVLVVIGAAIAVLRTVTKTSISTNPNEPKSP